MRYRDLNYIAGALVACLPMAVQPSKADGWFSIAPAAHISVRGVESQAQLAETLKTEGYSDVVLSSVNPSFPAPHPELNPERTSDPENTPVRHGWNGIAVKDGRTVDVYAQFDRP